MICKYSPNPQGVFLNNLSCTLSKSEIRGNMEKANIPLSFPVSMENYKEQYGRSQEIEKEKEKKGLN